MTVYSADWVLPIGEAPIRAGAIAVEDGRIAAVGTVDELGAGEAFPGAAILPGFVNAHSHLEYAVYAGFGDGLNFGEWILIHIERKARIGWDEFVAIARAGAAECLRSGITTVGDASFSGAAAIAAHDLGLRATVYLEVFGRGLDHLHGRFEESRARIEHVLGDRIRLGISPHAPYSVSPELYRACLDTGLPVMTHVAESAAEQRWLTEGEGPWELFRDNLPPPPGERAVRALARENVLRPGLVAAHCVHVDEDEIRLLAENGVAVAHCPRSNALLGCGIAPLADLRTAGVEVGLGTDSPASTPSFDMFEELRAAVFLARAREQRADGLLAAEALELATIGAARVLGLDGEVGSLAPGKRADVTVVSLHGSPYEPWEDPAAAVVFGGTPERILLTLTDGEERYRKGETQWRELTAAARHARSRLLQQAVATRAPT
jgi:cytosine/adenosine deaminase-related metal-dependent hydrolase